MCLDGTTVEKVGGGGGAEGRGRGEEEGRRRRGGGGGEEEEGRRMDRNETLTNAKLEIPCFLKSKVLA